MKKIGIGLVNIAGVMEIKDGIVNTILAKDIINFDSS